MISNIVKMTLLEKKDKRYLIFIMSLIINMCGNENLLSVDKKREEMIARKGK